MKQPDINNQVNKVTFKMLYKKWLKEGCNKGPAEFQYQIALWRAFIPYKDWPTETLGEQASEREQCQYLLFLKETGKQQEIHQKILWHKAYMKRKILQELKDSNDNDSNDNENEEDIQMNDSNHEESWMKLFESCADDETKTADARKAAKELLALVTKAFRRRRE